jgi:serine/threonine-protein kinase HipA
MAIGDNFNIRSLTAFDWAQMADECGLNPRLVSRKLKQLAEKILKTWPTLKPQLIASGAETIRLSRLKPSFGSNASVAKAQRPIFRKLQKIFYEYSGTKLLELDSRLV